MEGIIWLTILVIMVVFEIATLGLTTIWFAGGALVAFIASLLGLGIVGQIVLFILVSVLLLAGTRPFALRYFNKDRVRTNVESLIGTTGVVIEEIDNLNAAGMVQVNGQEWTARAAGDIPIPKDKIVVIKEIQGVKLIVEEKEITEG